MNNRTHMPKIKAILSVCMAIFFLVQIAGCGKDGSDKEDATSKKSRELYRVTASSGLNMRSRPDTEAPALQVLPSDTLVPVLEYTGESFSVEGREGRWARVSYNNKKGWVFSGFLKAAGAASGEDAASGNGEAGKSAAGKTEANANAQAEKTEGAAEAGQEKPEYIIYPGRGVGPLRLGEPVPDALFRILQGWDKKVPPKMGVGSGLIHWEGRLLVKLNDGEKKHNVFSIFIMDPNLFRTEKGIHVGSTVTLLKRAYPDGEMSTDNAKGDTMYKIKGLTFWINDNKVSQISMALQYGI